MRSLISKLLGRSDPDAAERASALVVGLFGKHPAWGDHIENLGDDSEVFLTVRTLLYREGLAHAIETGAWEKLPTDQRLPGFDHLFVWLLGDRLVIGLLWSSSDLRGRTEYPLVLAAETARLPLQAYVGEALPVLLRARSACQAALDQTGVRTAVATARAELQLVAQQAGSGPAAVSAGFRPQEIELARVLHELRGSSAHLSPGHFNPENDSAVAGPIRIALREADRLDLLDWLIVIESQLHVGVPLLGVAARAAGIGDLLPGLLVADALRCLRAGPAAIPLTSEIPYDLAPGIAAYGSSLLAVLRAGNRPVRTVFGEDGRGGEARNSGFPWRRRG